MNQTAPLETAEQMDEIPKTPYLPGIFGREQPGDGETGRQFPHPLQPAAKKISEKISEEPIAFLPGIPANAFSCLPIDHLVFTGSPKVGKTIVSHRYPKIETRDYTSIINGKAYLGLLATLDDARP
ncbi:MAG: hypothetical protein KKC20_18520 [Proteobacteria bacterium]|nr:hypothetical protein [Pseudomonadota bacterium]